MPITIANELHKKGIIRLPNLYANPELLNQLYDLLYAKEGYVDIIYSFIPKKRRYLKDTYKNRQNFYFVLEDLYDRDDKKLEGNSYVCVTHSDINGIKKRVMNYEETFTEYKISLKTLKLVLFKISITGVPLSHYINEEFLKGNIKQTKVYPYNKYWRKPCNKNK